MAKIYRRQPTVGLYRGKYWTPQELVKKVVRRDAHIRKLTRALSEARRNDPELDGLINDWEANQNEHLRPS